MEENSFPSIFAHDLAHLLQRAHYALDALRRQPFTLDPQKVARLERSLYDCSSQLPALNHSELMTIVLMLKLSDDECLGIQAALIALGAQRLLLDYLPSQRAWEIACEVRDAALAWLRDHRSEDDLFPRRRTLRFTPVESGAPGDSTLFAEALDAYDEGTHLTTLGLFRGDTDGRLLLGHALLCLERAKALLRLLPPSLQSTDDWQYWAGQIGKELDLVHQELE